MKYYYDQPYDYTSFHTSVELTGYYDELKLRLPDGKSVEGSLREWADLAKQITAAIERAPQAVKNNEDYFRWRDERRQDAWDTRRRRYGNSGRKSHAHR